MTFLKLLIKLAGGPALLGETASLKAARPWRALGIHTYNAYTTTSNSNTDDGVAFEVEVW
jgi:hypothetical protein